MNKVKIVDGLQESLNGIKAYEKTYGISSMEFMSGAFNDIIPTRDQCIWEFYVDCYIECGGKLDNKEDSNATDITIEDTISAVASEELINEKDIERGRDYKLSLPLFEVLSIEYVL